MSEILNQLGLDKTLFIQLGIYALVFAALSQIFFKPFLRLIEIRNKKTIQDRESAERILSQAQEKLTDYTRQLTAARLEAKAAYDTVIEQAKKEEAEVLSQARNEAKTITQDALRDMDQQASKLRKDLETEVDTMARAVTEKLLLRKV